MRSRLLKLTARYERKRQLQIAKRVTGARVLDIGFAWNPNPFLKQHGCSVVGYDLIRPSGEVPYDELIQGDVHDIDGVLEGRRFDAAIMGNVIEHLEEPYRALRAIHPLLEEDGQLILSTPNPLAMPILLFELARARSFFYGESHSYYFLPRWIRRMLERTGYRLDEIVPVGLWLTGVPCPAVMSACLTYVAKKVPS
jgi:2-polyprenyl-3-methyl-5-hydroxy-6-metoxy-1,4-benzoquinol methylase